MNIGVGDMGLTLAQLTQAIRRKVDEGMETVVAEGIAEHALGFFGFSNRIIDNALEPNDRNLFYQLQDYDLLTTESEETTLWDGREWRIHYWKFKSSAEAFALAAMDMRAKKSKMKILMQEYMMICRLISGKRDQERKTIGKNHYSKFLI
jgi:hypothetical protein